MRLDHLLSKEQECTLRVYEKALGLPARRSWIVHYVALWVFERIRTGQTLHTGV